MTSLRLTLLTIVSLAAYLGLAIAGAGERPGSSPIRP